MKDLIYLTKEGIKTTLVDAKSTNAPYKCATVDNTDRRAIVTERRASLLKEKGVIIPKMEHGKYITISDDNANNN